MKSTFWKHGPTEKNVWTDGMFIGISHNYSLHLEYSHLSKYSVNINSKLNVEVKDLFPGIQANNVQHLYLPP